MNAWFLRAPSVLASFLLVAGCVTPPGGEAPPATASRGDQAAASGASGWSGTAQAAIAAGEYAPRRVGEELRASNRAQDLRAAFRAGGAVISGRTTGAALTIGLRAWGREDHLERAGGAAPEEGPCLSGGATDAFGACLRRVDLPHAGLTEWWENRPEGLHHGFTITAPPDGDRPLVLDIAVSGAAVDLDGDIATLRRPGASPLVYAGLAAWDQRGRALPAWMEEADGGLRLVVDDDGAIGTITVDPLLGSESWTAEADQEGAQFGWAVASAGDVNGDGYGDVVIGAPAFDNGEENEGKAFVYLGSAFGLSSTASWTAESDTVGAFFAKTVAFAGDVDGDGYGDLLIGDPEYNGGSRDEGRILLYLGSATGLAATAAWTAESDQVEAGMGTSAGAAGDVNGDGYGDVIVSAPGYGNGESYEGRVFVFLGSTSGLPTTASWTAEGDQTEAYFGSSVASAGDVNGDGYSDVVIGANGWDGAASDEGKAVVYLGSASGLGSSASSTVEGGQASAQLGTSVAAAGDVNGDGYGDVIVGAPYQDDGSTNEGRAAVYLGSASGVASSPAWTAEGDADNAYLGASVASAADMNGDGYADVVVGARGVRAGVPNAGEILVYFGSAAGLPSVASRTASGDQELAGYGGAVASAGDVNGDGCGDLLVAAREYTNAEYHEGRVYLYLGSVGDLGENPAWTAEGDQSSAALGAAVASAGDVNGDGFGDVVVGARFYDGVEVDEGAAFVYLGSASGLATTAAWSAGSGQANFEFGRAVAAAGDVNGDGYGDLLVGAVGSSGPNAEGHVWLYLGSASGVAATAAWTVASDQAYGGMGWSVDSAGDVNGDGYDDVIASAYAYNAGQTQEGRAYVWLGSASGLATTPAWTAESDQVSAFFGTSVAGAGDVNGDGFADVVVGASNYGNGELGEGRAWLYLGSASGLATSAAWSAESNQAGARFGSSVASVGDVNGDGYDDVGVGAYRYTDSALYEGRAYVYLGSASGLATSASWAPPGELAGAYFGYSIAAAGDVNGDGYGDVIVGVPGANEGAIVGGEALVFLGAASGLSTDAWWRDGAGQAGVGYGFQVASAGDINGDGYGDVIVGAPNHVVGEDDVGAAFTYYGGGADGLPLSLGPQTRQADGATPIAPGLTSSATDGFTVAMATARGPWGRGQVRMELEVQALGEAFDGTDLRETAWTDSALSGADLLAAIDGLAPATGYHWRARVVHSLAEGRPQGWGRWIYAGLPGDTVGGHVFTAAGTLYTDLDGDGYGSAEVSISRGASAPGLVSDGGDCDDGDAAIHPGAIEVCDGADTDEDCNGLVDDADPAVTGTTTFYADTDGDGYGGATTGSFCEAPSAYVATSTDCDDAATDVHPGATEVCDDADVDEDCNGTADDADPAATGQATFYADTDGDGYAGATTGSFCDAPSGYLTSATDCDDASPSINPGGSEVCDAAETDEDCNGLVDDADPTAAGQSTFYADTDGDGYGGATMGSFCDAPSGYVATSTDCDDASAAVHPGTTEVCDAGDTDEDCNGVADDADPAATGQSTFYADTDGDGYGGATTGTFCDAPSGYVTTATDCNDADPAFHPGASEADCTDPNDYNCDGTSGTVDGDGDGYAACEDCDDGDAGAFPGGTEVVGDGVDGDCDGRELCYVDEDGDGYTTDTSVTVASSNLACDGTGEAGAGAGDGDCDDADPAFHPGATEDDCADPNDYNCDGSAGGADADGDGFAACEECDDDDATVNADATEVCNGVDDDCDGTLDVGAADAGTWYADADGDGYTDPAESVTTCDAPEGYAAETEADCDDADATRSPGATDVPDDGIDQDCDGADAAGDTGGDDTGGDDTGGDDTAGDDTGDGKTASCGCGTSGTPTSLWALALLALAARRRRGEPAGP